MKTKPPFSQSTATNIMYGPRNIIKRTYKILRRMIKTLYWLLAPNILITLSLRHAVLFCILFAIPSITRSTIKPTFIWIKFNIFLRIIKGKNWIIKYKKINLKIKNECNSFTEYTQYSSKLDEMNGLYPWRLTKKSNLYSYNIIYNDILELSKLRRKCDNFYKNSNNLYNIHPIRELMDFLRERMERNYCNITNPKLYSITKTGTKKLIEDFIDNICGSLEYITYNSLDIDNSEKIVFFNEIKHILGSTALCLSGGSTLGAYHGGLIVSMSNNNLLPKIISGSSIGACIASLVCTKMDDEYMEYSKKGVEFVLDTKEDIHWITMLYIRLRRFWRNGYLLDIKYLRECIRGHIGDITFLEAYNKTHRILNITVSGSDANTVPRILNYLTAPNVVIWSAAIASCAVPLVFQPQELYIKSSDNTISPIYLQGVTFSDGSIAHDLPMNKLSKLFNVNNFVVSQVNPHLVPFLFHSIVSPIPLFGKLFNFLGKEFTLYITTILVNLREFGILNGLSMFNDLFIQKYTGDITIVPDIPSNEYLNVLSNPSIQYVLKCTKLSQKGAWKHISRLQGLCATEIKIDQCLTYLRLQSVQK